MAEGVGFEPTVQLPVHGISSAAPSATRPPLPSGRREGSQRITHNRKFAIPQIWRRGEDLNPRGTCAPIRFRVGRLQPGSATPPRVVFTMLPDTCIRRRSPPSRNSKLTPSSIARRLGPARSTKPLDRRPQMIRLHVRVAHHQAPSVFQPPNSCTVRRSTPAITSRLANVCRQECHVTPSRPTQRPSPSPEAPPGPASRQPVMTLEASEGRPRNTTASPALSRSVPRSIRSRTNRPRRSAKTVNLALPGP